MVSFGAYVLGLVLSALIMGHMTICPLYVYTADEYFATMGDGRKRVLKCGALAEKYLNFRFVHLPGACSF